MKKKKQNKKETKRSKTKKCRQASKKFSKEIQQRNLAKKYAMNITCTERKFIIIKLPRIFFCNVQSSWVP